MITILILFIIVVLSKESPRNVLKGRERMIKEMENCSEFKVFCSLGADFKGLSFSGLDRLKNAYIGFLRSQIAFNSLSKYVINEKINIYELSFNYMLSLSGVIGIMVDMLQMLSFGEVGVLNFVLSFIISIIGSLAIVMISLIQVREEIEGNIQEDILILLNEIGLRLGSGSSLLNAVLESTETIEKTYFAALFRYEMSRVRGGVPVERSIAGLRSKTNSLVCDKFVQIVVNGFEFGDINLREKIINLNDEIWTMRFMKIKDHMERLKVKMVLPTMINFAAIMLMVVVPIIINLGGMFNE